MHYGAKYRRAINKWWNTKLQSYGHDQGPATNKTDSRGKGVSNVGFITVHGLNEGHISLYTCGVN